MSTATPERTSRGRILVALDASPRSLAALATAGALAAELDAELAGLFIEDVNLARLLELPFAREFCVLSGALRPLSQDDLERSWRREAAILQRHLAEAAARLQLRWSFQVARGRMAAEVSLQSQVGDLVVLGERASPRVSLAEQSATRARAHAAARPAPVMVLIEPDHPVDASLDLGVRLARRSGGELLLLIQAADEAAYRDTCEATQAALQERAARGRCVRLAGIERDALVRAVRREGGGCLVLAGGNRLLQGRELERMLDEIGCPVVLAR